MKTKQLIFIFFLALSPPTFSQATSVTDTIFPKADIPAEFPGGRSAMLSFLAKNLTYPCIESEEFAEFTKGYYRLTIEKSGKISAVEVLRSFPGLDESAVNCLKKMPDWIPATSNGQAVKSYYLLPISIHLD